MSCHRQMSAPVAPSLRGNGWLLRVCLVVMAVIASWSTRANDTALRAPSVDTVHEATATPTPSAAATAKRMSMQFHALDVRAALAVIAEFSGVNIVTADNVTGQVTLRLMDVPWELALDTILQAKGLGQRRQQGVIWVAPRTEIASRERQDHEHRAALQQLEPLQTRSFQLNYAKVADVMTHLLAPLASGASGTAAVAGTLSGYGMSWPGVPSSTPWDGGGTGGGVSATGPGSPAWGTATGVATTGATTAGLGQFGFRSPVMSAAPHGHPRFLSHRGVALAEPRTNQLFVTDIPARLDAVQRMLAQIDVPLRQVMIEARIVEAGDSFARSLGTRLATVDMTGQRSQSGNNLQTSVANTKLSGQADKSPDISGQALQLPAASLVGYDPGTLAFTLFNATRTRLLAVELSALEAEGQGRIVSNPKVVTADQIKAVIEQGTELPYQANTGNGSHAISFRRANLRLEVTPQITPEGGIILDVDLSKDSVGQMTPAGFAIDTKHLSTQVLVDDGGTVVIGGIYETSDTGQQARVPGLGSLPVLGALFGNRQVKRQKQELLVFLTPKMLPQRATAP